MGVRDELASAIGVKGQGPNDMVAKRCLARPELLGEFVEGLAGKDHRLAGDCAEVLTKCRSEARAHRPPCCGAPAASLAQGRACALGVRLRRAPHRPAQYFPARSTA
jgi:hypothetical protein